jgi:flagellar basal-body rod protein FlgB
LPGGGANIEMEPSRPRGHRPVTGLSEPSLIVALKTKMRWHEARQAILAENVANASTPDFRAHDLAAPEPAARGLGPARTDPGHMTLAAAGGFGRPRAADRFERTPDGNTVVLEAQMMKAAQNQMDHQMAATLYGKSLGLLRTALGRR